MDTLQATRTLMADSLGFHIIFVMSGIGLPLVFSLLEFWGIRQNKQKLIDAARVTSYVAGVLVVAGVLSGTIIAIQMSLMWPKLPEFGSKMIGLPFMFEGYAFILEALFLGYYLATWKKIKGYKHWALTIPVIIGSLLSAFFITSVSSWMNNPQGFKVVNGQIVEAHVWQGIFTPTTFFMVGHSVLGYYLTIFLVIVAVFGWNYSKNKLSPSNKEAHKTIIGRFALLALGSVLLVGVIGHFQTQYLAKSQPRKFAAIELIPLTTAQAPYVIGGELSEDGKTINGGIKIPKLLSILAGNSPSTVVRGLQEFNRNDWPMLVVNKLFELKMLFVGVLIVVPAIFAILLVSKWRKFAYSKPMLYAFLFAAPIAFVVVELGWMVTELGRQPFVVNGYLRTEDAFVSNPGILQWGYVFPTLYVILFVVTVVAIRGVLKMATLSGKREESQ